MEPLLLSESLQPARLQLGLTALNGVIGQDDVMNATTLPKVTMPNVGNFDSAYREPRRR